MRRSRATSRRDAEGRWAARRIAALACAVAAVALPAATAACGSDAARHGPPGGRTDHQTGTQGAPTTLARAPGAARAPARGGLQPAARNGWAAAEADAGNAPTVVRAASSRSRPPTLIVFVNVGQGDAVLVKSGGAGVLIDGGPEGSARQVARALRTAGIGDLDTVVVTHRHLDHIGATDDLVRAYDPERVLVAGRCDRHVSRAARATGARLVQVRRGDVRRWGAVKARVLSPGRLAHDPNADSVVLLLEVAGRRVLLTGDLRGPNERVVARLCAGRALAVLKVAHHGSRHSTSAAFLAATDPRVAVISVGDNPYGHPAKRTLARLRAAGARVYTTRRNGTIKLTISSSGGLRWRFGKSATPLIRGT